MANKPRPSALEVFQGHVFSTLGGIEADEARRPRRYEADGSPDPVQSLLWQVSLGAGLGVLSQEFVDDVESFTKRIRGLRLPSSVHGVDAGSQALRFFFEFASLEAELADPELAELVSAADRHGQADVLASDLKITTYGVEIDRPTYTWPLISAVLAGSENVDSDTAAACLEVMSQLLAFEDDILAFQEAVADLPHTAALVKKRFAAVHRAVAAITQVKGEPAPRELEYV